MGLVLACGLALAGCDSTNPVEPTSSSTATPQPGGGAYIVGLTVSPQTLVVGSNEPATVTVSVTQASDNSPASGVSCAVNTSLGSFSLTDTVRLQTVAINNGTGTLQLYPGTSTGTADLLAQVETSYGQAKVPIQEEVIPTFFLSSVTPNLGSVEGGTTVVIRGGGFRGTLRVAFNNVVATGVRTTGSAAPDGSFSSLQAIVPRSPQPVAAGTTLTVNVTVTNAINDPQPVSDTLIGGFTYTNDPPSIDRPVIFSVEPASGPNEGGQRVTIRGRFLPAPASNAEVLFGLNSASTGFSGLSASVQSAREDEIVVTTPPATGLGQSFLNQQVDVQVLNRSTGFSTVSVGAYRYTGASLFISSISQRTGSASGGETVTISGGGFQSPVQVQFGGATQEVVSVTSGTIVVRTVAVPVTNCSASSGPITVTNLGTGQSAQSPIVFSYTADRPFLQSVSPSQGVQAGGQTVTLNGQNFPASSFLRVEINDVASPQVNRVSATQVTAVTPPYTGTFDTESCTAPDGSAGSRNRAKAVDVSITDLQTGCSDDLPQAFSYLPSDTVCRSTTPPVADFTFDVGPGRTVRFFERASGSRPTRFEWDFGDNGRASGTEVTHTYAADGTYTVTLTVSNSIGSDSVSKQVTVPLPVVSPP